MMLTAGHDLDVLQLPLTLNVSKGLESYQLMRGDEQILKADDMIISDKAGIISNIIYGPDKRTQITAGTCNVVFTVYAPCGVHEEAVLSHLKDIQEYVMVFAPQSQVELLMVYS